MGIIIGDFREFEEKVAIGEMTQDEYQEIFSKARTHGLNDSVYPFAVGGSDAGIILGKSNFCTPKKLENLKKGVVTEIRDEKAELALFKGHIFEGPFRELFGRVKNCPTYPFYKQVQSEEFPHCVANIDGLTVWNGELWIYEGKTTSSPEVQATFRNGKAPASYLIQAAFYMAVLDELDEETIREIDPCLLYELKSFKIKGAVINCGWGLSESEMKTAYLERDEEVGKSILDICESFVLDIERGKPITNENVFDINLLKKDEYDNWGEIDKKAPPISIPQSYLPAILKAEEIEKEEKKLEEKLAERDAKVKAIKNEYSSVEKELKKFEKEKNELLFPLIDEYKNATKGTIEAEDRVITLTYDGETKSSLDASVKKKWREEYPEVYEYVMNLKKVNKREFKFE